MTKQTTLVVALLAVVVVAVIAFVVAEKKGKSDMTTVYGRSFMNIPHGPLHAEFGPKPRYGGVAYSTFDPRTAGRSSVDLL